MYRLTRKRREEKKKRTGQRVEVEREEDEQEDECGLRFKQTSAGLLYGQTASVSTGTRLGARRPAVRGGREGEQQPCPPHTETSQG